MNTINNINNKNNKNNSQPVGKTEILKSKLEKTEFDALLITSEVNERYVTGFSYQDGYAIITKKGVYLLTDFRYIEAARAQANRGVTVLMPEKGEKATDTLRRIMDCDGARRIAIEEATLSLSEFEKIKKSLEGEKKDIEFSFGASKIIDTMRIYKTSDEIEIMKRAQKITDAAFTHILNFIRYDMTEIEVALEIEFFMRRNGAESAAFETIAVSGSASSRPHGVPRNVRLEKGFFTMDFGAKVDGYCSDMTRTVVIGSADEEMRRLYDTVLRAQLCGLEAAVEGADCASVDKAARDIIDNAGYEGCFGHSLGHGVGMYIHEMPRLSSGASGVLEKGHVVTVEPGIYIEGKYGCRIEDMIAITDNGAYDFTQSPKELIQL